MIRIEQEIIDQPDVERLFRASDDASATLYPETPRPGPTIRSLLAAGARFFVARRDGTAVGCAGFVPEEPGVAELKRLFVSPAVRGRAVGEDLVRAAEALAANERFAVMRLETGLRAVAALRLYRRLGYAHRPPYGPFAADPLSVFMEKPLGQPAQPWRHAP